MTDKMSYLTENFIGLMPMDILILILAVALSVTCFLRGFSRKFCHSLGWVASIFGSLHGQQWLSFYLQDLVENDQLRSYISIILLTAVIFIFCRKMGSILSMLKTSFI